MKMLSGLYFALMCMMHTVYSMTENGVISRSNTKKVSSLSSFSSLKDLCFNILIKQEPEKAKQLFCKKVLPADLLHELADKIAENPSSEDVGDFAAFLPTQTYPSIYLRNIMWENISERQFRVEKIGGRLFALADEINDNATTKLLKEMKKVIDEDPQFFYTTESNSENIKKALFYGTLEISSSLDFAFLLLDKGCSLKHYQFIDCVNDLNVFEGFSVMKLAQLREKYLYDENIFLLREFAQKNNLNNLLAEDIEKIALGLTFSIRINRILASVHKIFHLGLFHQYFEQFKSFNQIVVYILNRLCELDDDWSFDSNYARFKNEWDQTKHLEKNIEYADQIRQFHVRNTKKICISAIILDDRYCRDLSLFTLMMNRKRNFYISMLKLLSFYCPIEFEQCKEEFFWRLSIPPEKVDAYINENTFYDAKKYINEWQKNN